MREQFEAMGTVVSVLAPVTMQSRAPSLVRTLFSEWESVLSRFRPESELSFVNAHAGSPMRVSRLFWRVVSVSLEAARATEGIYDPAMGRQIVESGYDRSFNDVPAQRPALHASPSRGGSWRAIRLDPSIHAVTLPIGVHLDFGGIAKGLAVDAAIDALEGAGLTPVLVEAGGDLRVSGALPAGKAWTVAVEVLQGSETISLFSGGIATSSRLRRFWRAGEMEMHHILDSRTGLPAASDVCSVSVAAATCVQADVAAKTAFILGTGAGREFLHDYGLSGLMVEASGNTVRVGNWPARRGAA